MTADEIRSTYPLTSLQIVAELVALSVVEHSYSPDNTITISVDGARCEIVDTGRGMQLRPDPGDTVSHAERALTSVYPIDPLTEETKQLLTRLVWGPRGSLGPALANANCVEFEFTANREGEAWSQRFQFGVPNGPASFDGPTNQHGTTVRLLAPDAIDLGVVRMLVASLTASVQTLQITCD
jgi:DNA gyrase/topoisomerase IV subunit B